MNRLLVFTENYNVGSGGASFIVDLVNGASDVYDDIVFASNPTGFAPDTSPRVVAPHVMREKVRLCTADRIGVDLTAATWLPKHHQLAGRLRQMAINHEPRLFRYNVGVCKRLIKRERADMVIAYNGGYPAARSVLAMTVAAHELGLPVVLVVVSVPAERPEGAYGAWEQQMDELVGASADLIIVNARTIGDRLTHVRGLPADKMRVIHNALPDLRPKSVPGEGTLRIGCVSRMDNMKGTRFLVEAFERIAQTHPHAELMLVGDGPERSNVAAQVAEAGLSDRVIMTGHYVGDVNELVGTFDIYAFPSLWEGLPYALLEAMRAGKPIVATDVGGIAEAVVDGETGILVPPASADALAEGLRRLVEDESLRQRFGRAGRARYEDSFSLEAMGRRTRAVFAEVGLVREAPSSSHGEV